jgi:hypothetical protein
MKKRTFGVVLTVAIVLVLSIAVVASASAAPYITGVSPTSGSNTNYSTFTLKIFGQNYAQILDIDSVTLEMSNYPFDVIYASDPYVVNQLGGDYIACDISTYLESAGSYDVVVDYFTGFGQTIPDEMYKAGAFTVIGTPPVTGPTIASVRPESAIAGGPSFTLTVNGANLGTNPTVYWNSTALVTAPGGLPNPTATCTAIVPASLIAVAGNAQISVMSNGLLSNYIPYHVTAPVPTLTSLNPATTWAGYRTPPLVTVTGTNFQSGAQVFVNGVVHASTFVGATQLTVQLSAADIAAAGTLNFVVRNGASGTPTATVPFTVNAETTMPVTTITGADSAWHNQPVTLTITATDSQSGVWKTMFGIGASMPWTQLTGSTLTVPGPMGGDPNGVNVVSAYAIDNCNVSGNPPVQATVNICTTGPQTEAFAPSSVKKGKSLKISFIADSITPQCDITVKIYNSSGVQKKAVQVGQKDSNQKGSTSFTCNLSPGKYKVKVFAVDAAGNNQSSMSADSFQVTK